MSDEIFSLASVAAHIVRDVTLFLDAPATMTSREIADLVGARHDNVKRAVDRLVSRGIIELPPMEEVKNHLGQTVTEYRFTGENGKRNSIVAMAQVSPEFTAALVDRWVHLEREVKRLQTQLMEKELKKQLTKAMDSIQDSAAVMNKTQASKSFAQKAKGIHELMESQRRSCTVTHDEAQTLHRRITQGLVDLGVVKPEGSLKAAAYVAKHKDVMRLYARECGPHC